MNSEHTFSNILTQSSILQELVSKTEILTKINRIVQQKLDPSLRPHCRVTNFRDGILILSTHSPVWGHALRFQEGELLKSLSKDLKLLGIKSIQTRVCPKIEYENEVRTQFNALKISASNAMLIQSVAETMSYSPLQIALLKLSKHSI